MPPHQLSASLEPKSIPIPRLKSKNGKGFPEEGEVGAEGLWFGRAPQEAKKKSSSEDCSVCRNEAKGNLVNWETADFSVVNMARRDVPMESVCRPARPGSVLVPNRRTFDSLAGLCGKFRGRMTVVRSQEQQAEMSSLFAGSAACNTRAKGYWNGWEDRREEGKFVDHNKERNTTKRVTHNFFARFSLF